MTTALQTNDPVRLIQSAGKRFKKPFYRMKPYHIPSHRLHEIVQAPKCLPSGESTGFETKGSRGLKLDARLDLIDGDFVGLRLFVHAGDREIVTTYESGLCVAGPRVRGIGYSPLRVF